jgi:hypothetical protein
MRKKVFTFLVLMVFVFSLTQTAIAAYDGAQVKTSMETIGRLFKDLNTKVASKDYYAAAERFMDIAKFFKNLDSVTPPGGSQEQWESIHGALINSAFKGIGACGAKDDMAIKQSMGEMIKFRNEGHKLFKH